MKNTLLAVTAALAMGMLSVPAQAVEYLTQATMGPILNGGSDPQGFNGFSGQFIIRIPSSAVPTSHTATTATYSVSAGNMILHANSSIGAHTLKSTGTATLKITVSPKGPDKIQITGPVQFRGNAFNLSWTAVIPNGSFSSSALKHPTKFTPSPASVSSPASFVSYTGKGATKLGLAGMEFAN